MLELTERGLYCPLGDFYIDPWRGVRRALIIHGHGDHARPGSESYLTVNAGLRLLRAGLGSEVAIETKAYGESTDRRCSGIVPSGRSHLRLGS